MITINLYGLLEKFGGPYVMDVKSPAEAVRALCAQIPGLEGTIKAGNWHVLRGALEEQDDADEESLTLGFGSQKELHILPAVEGAGSGGGVLAVVAGIVLIAVGFFTFGATTPMGMALIAGGIGMAIGGIVMMTTKVPEGGMNQEAQDDKASFLLGKPVNNSTQGVSIPRGYGRCLVGSVVISTSLSAHEIDSKTTPQTIIEQAMNGMLGK